MKLLADRRHDLLKHPEVFLIAAARGKRDIDRKPLALPRTRLLHRAAARIERELMGGKIENRRVPVECVLGAIAMMDIPIDYHNPLHAVMELQVMGADGHRVKQAEPHGAIPERVMAGRADQGKAVAKLGGGNKV